MVLGECFVLLELDISVVDLTLYQQVSKYYPNGSLVKFLKGRSDAEAARLDTLKMMHEISKGMTYLHREGVLHGDLKVQLPQS